MKRMTIVGLAVAMLITSVGMLTAVRADGTDKKADAAAARQRDLAQSPACVADAEKFCPNEKLDLTGVIGCLRVHMTDVSSECKSELGKRTGAY